MKKSSSKIAMMSRILKQHEEDDKESEIASLRENIRMWKRYAADQVKRALRAESELVVRGS